MSASVIQRFYDAMRSMDPVELAASFADDVVIEEPRSLPFGGTTTSRDEFYKKVVGYYAEWATFQIQTSEVLGDGDRLAGHFTATYTAHATGDTVSAHYAELYEVRDGAISRVTTFVHDLPELIDFFARNEPTS
jgi:uncharacterized protein